MYSKFWACTVESAQSVLLGEVNSCDHYNYMTCGSLDKYVVLRSWKKILVHVVSPCFCLFDACVSWPLYHAVSPCAACSCSSDSGDLPACCCAEACLQGLPSGCHSWEWTAGKYVHYAEVWGEVYCRIIITPHACTRGKAIGLYVCCHRCRRCPHENHQFGRSRPLSDL